jgi:aminoglycoside/choline kinase family phosphotransferase
MTERARQITEFLSSAGWANASRTVLAGDASNRRYDRLTDQNGNTAVLMDAPADRGEDVRPFLAIANWLSALGLSAPEILHADTDNGLLLIEDLGDDLFVRVIANDPGSETMLYQAAVDVLIQSQQASPPPLPSYDADRTVPLAALAFDWYQHGATGQVDTDARMAFMTAMDAVLRPLDALADVLIQRDYHAENLLWLPQRSGAARVGLLDFQDAMLGHCAYDLVSILQDARRDVPAQTEARMIQYFLDQTGLAPAAFRAAYAALGVQRNLRILGVFARLCMRDGKAHYVDMIPRVWAHVQTNLRHQDLAHVADTLRAHLPEPTPDILKRLKAQCRQHPTR